MRQKTKIKRLLKWLFKALIILWAPVLIYLLAGIILSFISTSPEKVDCTEKQTVYLSSNGVHLDFILPKDAVGDTLSNLLNISENISYLAFGWGDKGFYLETPTWGELKFRVAFEAMFMKTGTAMHLTYYRRRYNSWIPIALCESQLDRLRNYIREGFQTNQNGQFVEILGAGYTGQDRFFEGTGHYSCFKTCNNWTNIGLKKAGVKTAVWSPFDYGVLYHLEQKDQ